MEAGLNAPTVLGTFVSPLCHMFSLAMAFVPLVLLSLVDKGKIVYLADNFPKAHKGICTGLLKASVTVRLCFIRFLKNLEENPT